jgi:Zincin-like metallopeptidase
LTVLAAKI